MTTTSYTGRVTTNNEFVTVESVTGLTLTAGKSYTMQILDSAWLKVADAEFWINNKEFQYKHGTDDLYIKTDALGCQLALLENSDDN